MAKKRLLLVLVLSLMVGIAAAQTTEVKLTDFVEREITLAKPAERIVALMPADCEILYALGAEDLLVGRGEYCNYPEAILEKEVVKSGQEMNLEQIIALSPDVVVASKMNHSEEQINALENAGVKTVIIDAQNLSDVYKAITLLGQLTGKAEKAEQLNQQMQNDFAEVVKEVDGRTAGTVYYEASPLQYGLWAAGGGTFMNELGSMIGLKNIFAQQEGWPQVSEEQVIKANPDFIVSTTMYFGEGPKPVEEIFARQGWQDIAALKNSQVMNADNDEITRPGPRLVNAIRDLYKFVYENGSAGDNAA